MANVTVLGLGAMGSRMAMSLLAAKHDVTVWNRDAKRAGPLVEQGAFAAASPAEAVKKADFALAMVRDVAASRQVWLDGETGALAALPSQAVAIECSTITVAWAQELATAFTQKGRSVIDAPVSGSRKQADAKELIFLAGGEAAAVEKATPVLLAIGKSVEHMGPAGTGTAIKLMVNAALAAQVASIAELLGMVTRHGIAPQKAMDVYNSTVVSSAWIKANTPALLAGDYAPQFTVELIEKDLNYALEAAEAGDGESGPASAPVSKAARDVFAKAAGKGLGEQNLTAICELYS
jgi:3-hydroxyisobutyrate dehydrogenase-like beta-hydroxyacid dehydrogenase